MTLHSVFHFLTSFKGRTSREAFNRFFLFLGIMAFVVNFIDMYLINNTFNQEANSLILVYAVLFIVTLCALTARRLHDMNLSGRWQLLWHAMPVLIIIKMYCISHVSMPDYIAMTLIVSNAVVITLYVLFWMALNMMRGTKGPNKYGPDPLQKNVIDNNNDNVAVAS